MTILRLALFTVVLLGSPSAAQAQSSPRCDADSASAEAVRLDLQVLLRTHPDGARAQATWVPGDDICAAAEAVLPPDSINNRRLAKRYVFKLSRYGTIRFAVVDHDPLVNSEWKSLVCFFDEKWRKKGICLAA